MEDKFQLEIISPEKIIFSDSAKMIKIGKVIQAQFQDACIAIMLRVLLQSLFECPLTNEFDVARNTC